MNHLHYEFDANDGDVIEVTLDRAANVQLLDTANYENYTNGRGYRYQGGYATTSPVRLAVPRAGKWHVVIDFGGGAGRVRATARLVSGAMV
jgi:Domain of unknown function (DUF1883)